MSRPVDITGKTFGRLQTIKRIGSNAEGRAIWLFKCLGSERTSCGREIVLTAKTVAHGRTQSCGCLQRERAADTQRTHGKCGSFEYRVWSQMKQRCLNPKQTAYSNYGGRGITICDKWMIFENFIKDMGKAPDENHTIDRINNNGNYELDNCRWTTYLDQAHNKRYPKNKHGVIGVSFSHRLNKYIIRITDAGRRFYLGFTDNLEEAKRIRIEGEIKYWGKQVSQPTV